MKIGSKSRKFLIAYFLWITLLFGIFYFNTNSLAVVLNEIQRDWLLKSLKYLLKDMVQDIYIYPTSSFRIRITYACNGLIPYYFYLASIFAYPSSWILKIIWAVIGYFVIYVVNLLRLLFVTEMTKSGGSNFRWSHDIIGHGMLMITGLPH